MTADDYYTLLSSLQKGGYQISRKLYQLYQIYQLPSFVDRYVTCCSSIGSTLLPERQSKTQILTCRNTTIAQKYKSVQFGTECFTAINADQTYQMYGPAENCKDGRGGYWAQSVYKTGSCPGIKLHIKVVITTVLNETICRYLQTVMKYKCI